MKIDEQIRAAYSVQYANAVRLKELVDKAFDYHRPREWHYISRVKEEEEC